jgi:S-adenosylmethionine decarboxylase
MEVFAGVFVGIRKYLLVFVRLDIDISVLGGYEMGNKLKLYGFNNLTKALSFNIYDVCYAKSKREQQDYIDYIDEQYNSERLTNILLHVTDMIGANALNVSTQDYDL